MHGVFSCACGRGVQSCARPHGVFSYVCVSCQGIAAQRIYFSLEARNRDL